MKKTLTLSLLLAGIAQATTTSSEYTQDGNSTTLYVADNQTSVPNDVTGKETIILGSSNVNLGSDWYIGRYSLGNCDTLKNVGTIVIAQGSISDGSASKEYVGGQLFIQAAGEITSHLKLGTSGYNEGQYGGAVRFHNETNDNLVLTGGITLIQDASLSVGGKGAYIQGTIAGQGKNLTLTQTGELRLSGGATLQTLDSTAKVTLDDKKADGSTDAASKVYTMSNVKGTGTLVVDKNVTLNLTGHASDQTLQTSTKAIINSGIINIGSASTLDISNGATRYNSKDDSKIVIQNGGKLIVKSGFEFTAVGTQNATFQLTTGDNQGYNCSSANYKLTNAQIKYNANVWTDFGNTLENCSLLNEATDGGHMNFKGSLVNNSLLTLGANTGSVYLLNQENVVSIGSLSVVAGKAVQAHSGSDTKSDLVALSVTDSLTTTGSSSATIKASMLTLADGVTLNFGSSVTLSGDLTMNSNLVLADGMLGEDGVTLFTNVTGLTLATGVYTAPVDAATVFAGVETGAYNLVFADNVVSLQAAPAVPEPATATLSLLALAGLCARRRRK